MVADQLRARGVTDERVLAAMGAIPREAVRPRGDPRAAPTRRGAPDRGRPDDQPAVHGRQDDRAPRVEPGDRILEIGTGSGYQAAILAWLGAQVTSLERQATLIEAARARIAALGPARPAR